MGLDSSQVKYPLCFCRLALSPRKQPSSKPRERGWPGWAEVLTARPRLPPLPACLCCTRHTPVLLQVLYFSESLVPTARKALCDPLEEVREAAAKTFEQLHSTIGHQALEDILPFLLKQLVSGSPHTYRPALLSLRKRNSGPLGAKAAAVWAQEAACSGSRLSSLFSLDSQ